MVTIGTANNQSMHKKEFGLLLLSNYWIIMKYIHAGTLHTALTTHASKVGMLCAFTAFYCRTEKLL